MINLSLGLNIIRLGWASKSILTGSTTIPRYANLVDSLLFHTWNVSLIITGQKFIHNYIYNCNNLENKLYQQGLEKNLKSHPKSQEQDKLTRLHHPYEY